MNQEEPAATAKEKTKQILRNLTRPLIRDGQIFLIVLLGIGGMALCFGLLQAEIRINGYRTEYWPVTDTAKAVVPGKITTVDTLKVTYHAQIGARLDSIKKLRGNERKNGLKPQGVISKSYVGYNWLFFTYNSAFLVWLAFVSIMTGFSLAFLPVLFIAIRDLITGFRIKWWTMVYIAFFTVIIGWLMSQVQDSSYLMGATKLCRQFGILVKDPDSLRYYVNTGLITGLAALAGQMTVNAAIGKLPQTIRGLSIEEQRDIAKKFTLLRNQLKLFLIIDSVLVVFSVLTTDAFRRAITAEIQVNMDIIPQNFVYLFGLMFTFYLAIVYLPVYSRLKARGEQMLDEIPLVDQEGNQKEITSILRIQQTPVESIQVVLSILAPVLTSLVPGLLKI